MPDVKKILVPIDFSDENAGALKHGAALARQTRAELLALHVIPAYDLQDYFMFCLPGPGGPPLMDVDYSRISVDDLLREAARDVGAFIAKNVEATAGINITTRLRIGSLVKEIALIVGEEKIDLVVVELRKRFLTTLYLLKVVRKLPCPVLLGAPVAERNPRPRGRLIAFPAVPRGMLLNDY